MFQPSSVVNHVPARTWRRPWATATTEVGVNHEVVVHPETDVARVGVYTEQVEVDPRDFTCTAVVGGQRVRFTRWTGCEQLESCTSTLHVPTGSGGV